MSTFSTASADLFQQGVLALKAGNKDQAADLLIRVLQRDPNNEQAWLWLSGAVQSDDERRECLEHVLEINPHNQAAQRGLQKLGRSIASAAPLPDAQPSAPETASYAALAPAPVAEVTTSTWVASPTHRTEIDQHPAPISSAPRAAAAQLDEEAVQFVIEQFGKHRSSEEIARALCARYSWPWDRAEQCIANVQSTHGRQIATRQAPYMIALAIFGIIVGFTMFVVGSYRIYTRILSYNVFNVGALGRSAVMAVTGLGMLLGSIMGIWQTIVAVFKG